MMRNGVSRRVARRFVAGQTLDDAVKAARAINATGITASLDLLGENVSDEDSARRSAQDYLSVFDRIEQEKLEANVSLKLTQVGLDAGDAFCQELLERIAVRAAAHGNFVRVDMEGSGYTQRTIDIVRRVRSKHANVGTVLQAYLYRTEQDAQELIQADCRIRLCKGAYDEPASVAFPKKRDVDANYNKLMKLLLSSGIYHGIATHDPAMIQATKNFARERNIRRDQFEFQMLYGIRTDLQKQLVREGYRVRVYIPYGTEWFPYCMRRLAERPANLTFFLRSLFPRLSPQPQS
jgi:proline dehydrogenase